MLRKVEAQRKLKRHSRSARRIVTPRTHTPNQRRPIVLSISREPKVQNTIHIARVGIQGEANNNRIERLHGTIRERNKPASHQETRLIVHWGPANPLQLHMPTSQDSKVRVRPKPAESDLRVTTSRYLRCRTLGGFCNDSVIFYPYVEGGTFGQFLAINGIVTANDVARQIESQFVFSNSRELPLYFDGHRCLDKTPSICVVNHFGPFLRYVSVSTLGAAAHKCLNIGDEQILFAYLLIIINLRPNHRTLAIRAIFFDQRASPMP